MKKTILSTILVLLLSFSLVGCKKEKTVTLTVYSQLANYSGKMTGWFAQIAKEKFNVELVIVPDSEGTYATRMESGDLGDIVVWGSDGEDYQNAVSSGMLFDWEQDDLLEEFGPYIKENYQDALEKNRKISGGKVYGFGHEVAFSSDDIQSFFYTWDIRWDLYNRLGRPEINDLDDYYDLLVAMKALEPTDENGNPTYAASLWPDWDGNMVMYVKAFATAYYGLDELGVGLYDTNTGDFYGALDRDGYYLKALEFFNRLYRANLLDPDSMSQTFDEMAAKVRNGGTFMSIFNYAGSLSYNTTEHIEDNKLMLPLVPNEARTLVYGLSTLGGNRVWSIGASSQYPELAMEIINWLATPEGRLTTEYGPKDVNWYYDENGKTTFTELGKRMRESIDYEFPKDSGFSGRFADGRFEINNTTIALDTLNPDSSGDTFNWELWESNLGDPRNDLEAQWREHTGYNHGQLYIKSTNYNVAIGSEYAEGRKDSELKVTWELVTKVIVDNSWNAIYAKTPEEFNSVVNQMIFQANKAGYAKTVTWSQSEAAARFAAEEAIRNK